MNTFLRRLPILAVCLLACACGTATGPTLPPSVNTITDEWLEERLVALSADDMNGRNNLTPGGKKAREYLKQQMADIGLLPAGANSWEEAFSKGVNIIGMIPGQDPILKDQYVILSAHYDHLGRVGDPSNQCRRGTPGEPICNGAADNASGCAAILAVAKALLDSGIVFRRSVLVIFFDAEEDGLLGSKYFVQAGGLYPMQSIAAVFNLDLVGTRIFKGVDSTYALGTERTVGLRERILANSALLGLSTYPVSAFFDGSDNGERSDHYYFVQAGVPAIFFSSGAPPEYHSPADKIDIIDREKLLLTTKHLFLMTLDTVNDDQRPSFSQEPVRTVDDAVALHALGEHLLADPASAGLDDPLMLSIVQGWMVQLQGHIDHPPRTEAEWETYEDFVHSVLQAVYLAMGQ